MILQTNGDMKVGIWKTLSHAGPQMTSTHRRSALSKGKERPAVECGVS